MASLRGRELFDAGGSTVFAALASVAALALTARALGPEGRGYFAALTAWAILASTLGSLSVGQVISVRSRDAPRGMERRSARVIGGPGRAASVACWIALAIIHQLGGIRVDGAGLMPILIAFATLPLLMWNDNGRYLLFALNRVRTYGQALVLGHSVNLAVLGVAALTGRLTLAVALWSWAMLYLAIAMVSLTSALSHATRLRVTTARLRAILKGSVRLHSTTVATLVQLQASVLIVAHYRGAAEAGLYQLATQIVAIGTLIPMAASIVCYRIVATDGPDAGWSQQRRLIGLTLSALVVAIRWDTCSSPMVVSLVAGSGVPAGRSPAVRLMLAALVGMGMSMMMESMDRGGCFLLPRCCRWGWRSSVSAPTGAGSPVRIHGGHDQHARCLFRRPRGQRDLREPGGAAVAPDRAGSRVSAPGISAILPTYNQEAYVTEAATSLLSQDHDDFEVVARDDGSSDQTPRILIHCARRGRGVYGLQGSQPWCHRQLQCTDRGVPWLLIVFFCRR